MSTSNQIEYLPFHIPPTPPLEWEMQYDAPCSLYTHPAQIAAVAKMAGHQPPPIETARILEIGSAVGGNLNVIAATLPKAQCIGIDPFEAQVIEAQKRADQSGLSNVRHLPIGIEELGTEFGEFDYIIGHGLFSWIDDHARKATLETCARSLSEQGIGYLSYNTYPRWYVNQLSRSLMRWRGRSLKKHETFIHSARSILKLFGHHATPLGVINPRNYFKKMSNFLMTKPDYYLAHEYLLEQNTPFHFHEFIQKLANLFQDQDPHKTSLTYLGDASLNTELAHWAFEDDLYQKEIENLNPTRLAFEETLDHLFHRSIRRSIFTRSSSPCARSKSSNQHHIGIPPSYPNGKVKRVYELTDFESIWLHSPFEYQTQESSLEAQSLFQHRHHKRTITTQSLEQSVLLIILSASWPHSIPAQLCIEYAQEMYTTLTSTEAPSKNDFLKVLQQCLYFEWIAPPRLNPPPLLEHLSPQEKPCVIPTLLKVDPPFLKGSISNLYHDLLNLSPQLQTLIPYLDGTHTWSQLASLAFPQESKKQAMSLVQSTLEEAYNGALLIQTSL